MNVRSVSRLTVPVLSGIAVVAVVAATVAPVLARLRLLPPGTEYYLGGGYLPDYYQYLSWVKSGMDGAVLLTTRFDVLPQTPVLMHPFFLAVGWLSRLFRLTPYAGLFAARIFVTVVFLAAVFRLIDRLFARPVLRIAGRLVLLSVSCFWSVGPDGLLSEPVSWSTNFDVIGKFTLSPHHLAALAAVVWTLMAAVRPPSPRRTVLLILLPVTVAFLNPSLSLIFLIVYGTECALWALETAIRMVRKSPHGTRPAFPAAAATVLAASAPPLLYNQMLFASVHPWNLMYTLMRHFRPPVTLTEYLAALGPAFPLAVVAATDRKTWTDPLRRALLVWGVAPVLLFPLVGRILPLNESRLFQLYQYVPLALLATAGLERLDRLLAAVTKRPVAVGLGTLALAGYAVFPTLTGLRQATAVGPAEFQNYLVYATPEAAAAYRFLNTAGGDGPVVAGEYTSQLVAALTPHRVLLGRDDSVREYYGRRAEVFDLVNGKLSADGIRTFAAKYGARYVLFGIDTYPFESLPYGSTGIFREVFRSGRVSVQEILR